MDRCPSDVLTTKQTLSIPPTLKGRSKEHRKTHPSYDNGESASDVDSSAMP
jgi:hypothetical protein